MEEENRAMSRIPPRKGVQVPPGATTVGGANMSLLFEVMAHRPTIMDATAHLLEAVMGAGTVESQLKELLAVRVSQVNHCFY
jgi:alkylhydroperoxidase family enzyme